MDPTRMPLPPSPPVSGNAVPVTPSPVVLISPETSSSGVSIPSLAYDEFRFLFRLLGLSEADQDTMALCDFLTRVGLKNVGDLVILEEADFQELDCWLPPMMKRKLLYIRDFLNQGGSLEEIDSIREIVRSVRSSAESSRASSAKSSRASSPASVSTDEGVVILEVGGYRFTTTKETLCRVPGSLLESMFSGRHQNPAPRNQDGAYVIDRNGMHFHHILDFLRVGAVVSLPPDDASKQVLALEADFYGLEALVRAIRAPRIDTTEYLSEEVLDMRNEEDILRESFIKGLGREFDPHRGLVPIFCPQNGIRPLPLLYEPLDGARNVVMASQEETPPGTPVTASSLEEFQSNFNREHPNVLHRLSGVLNEEPVIIAGGSVLRALTSSPGVRTADWWGKKSDIDLFLHCREPEEANRIARRIFYSLAVDQEQWVIMRSRGVITMHNWVVDEIGEPRRIDLKIQIVLRLYDSPTEVLVGFDCDSCCCAYDGTTVWLTRRGLHALRTGLNILNPLHAWPIKPSYELRLGKYARRGFAAAVPGLDMKRVDGQRIRRTRDLRDLRGMARLMKVSFEIESVCCSLVPEDVDRLRDDVTREHEEPELVMRGMSGYDDVINNVIIPRVFGPGDGALGMMWYDWVGGQQEDFPIARHCREAAWLQIADAEGIAPDGVPDRLVDSWDVEKRSREYLNSALDKFYLDNVYYAEAYETDA